MNLPEGYYPKFHKRYGYQLYIQHIANRYSCLIPGFKKAYIIKTAYSTILLTFAAVLTKRH